MRLRAVLLPTNRDYPVGLRSGVDFRAPGARDPATKQAATMPPPRVRMGYWRRKAQREGRCEVHVIAGPGPTHTNLGPVGPVTITGDC